MQNTRLIKEYLVDLFFIAFASFLASVGLKAFLLPNGFLDGGVTGISILMTEFFHVDISLILPILSTPFFILSWFTLSRKILYKSIIAILLLSFFIFIESFSTVTEDKLLIAIFGGALLGAGIGLSIRHGAVLDGVEILGIFVNQKFGISIGTTVFAFNIILFGIAGVLISLEVALYSIITFMVTAKTIDIFVEGFEHFLGYTVVSKNLHKIEKKLIKENFKGYTIQDNITGHGSSGLNTNLKSLQLVVNRIDGRKLESIVRNSDPKAFIIQYDVNHVEGGVLRRFLK